MEYEIPILNSRLIQHPPSYMSCQNSFSEIFSKFMYDNKESIAGQLKTIQDLRYLQQFDSATETTVNVESQKEKIPLERVRPSETGRRWRSEIGD
jgi:hypothetical protein